MNKRQRTVRRPSVNVHRPNETGIVTMTGERNSYFLMDGILIPDEEEGDTGR